MLCANLCGTVFFVSSNFSGFGEIGEVPKEQLIDVLGILVDSKKALLGPLGVSIGISIGI